jgi:hypothetical protein
MMRTCVGVDGVEPPRARRPPGYSRVPYRSVTLPGASLEPAWNPPGDRSPASPETLEARRSSSSAGSLNDRWLMSQPGLRIGSSPGMGNRLLARAIFLVRPAGLCHLAHLARHDRAHGPPGPKDLAGPAIAPILATATGLIGAGPHPARTRGNARGG